jgi:hypothetical protein
MYGTWFNITVGLAVGSVVLVIALVIAASPLLAVAIALVLGGLAALGAAMRRSGEYLDKREAERHPSKAGERIAPGGISPKPPGAPASGEGDGPGALPPNPGAPTRQAGA